MTNQTALGLASTILSSISFFLYIRDVLNGRTKPHAYSWLIWAIIGSIGFFGQRTDNAGAGSWVTALLAALSLFIFLLSLKYGEKSRTKFDTGCLALCLVAIPLWILTETPFWSMILVTMIDAIGFLPTWRKSWNKPYEETTLLYLLGSLSFLCSVFALNKYSIITGLYPTVCVLMNFSTAVILILRRFVMDTKE